MFQEDRRTKLFTLGATCFGLFMVMLDNTVVNLALPTIQREMGSDISGLQWIVDSFILLLATFMLTGGTLGDLYGRKRAFLSGLVIFTAGSLLCALSPSVAMLIAGRVDPGHGRGRHDAVHPGHPHQHLPRSQGEGAGHRHLGGSLGDRPGHRAGGGRADGRRFRLAEHLLPQRAHRGHRLRHRRPAGAGVQEP